VPRKLLSDFSDLKQSRPPNGGRELPGGQDLPWVMGLRSLVSA
jgi:hypothetical protein